MFQYLEGWSTVSIPILSAWSAPIPLAHASFISLAHTKIHLRTLRLACAHRPIFSSWKIACIFGVFRDFEVSMFLNTLEHQEKDPQKEGPKGRTTRRIRETSFIYWFCILKWYVVVLHAHALKNSPLTEQNPAPLLFLSGGFFGSTQLTFSLLGNWGF